MSQTLMLHGQFENRSSFALVNQRLATGLSALGYHVIRMPSDGDIPGEPNVTEPDIYLVHDHPYDVLNAPGRVNAFFLEYDYARILKRDQLLVERLNHFFDVVLVPSRFVRAACEHSGIRIPIAVCPLGADRAEFQPAAPPVALPTSKRFKFIYVGGANERKGTDLLLEAFGREFSAREDVALVLKTFGYEHLRAEFEGQLTRAQERRNAPEIVHIHGNAASVAGYFTAADCGVFPFRGEGFGLSILECLASGRPVIVTKGGGPLDYCTKENATLLAAPQVTRRGKIEYAPPVGRLRELLRAAFELGKQETACAEKISRCVVEWTWQRTVAAVDRALKAQCAKPVRRARGHLDVSYTYLEKGNTSWRRHNRTLERTLAQNFAMAPSSFRDAPRCERVDVVVGESGAALEHFVRARRMNPAVKRILRRGNGPLESVLAVENLERERCGLPPRLLPPIEYWRQRREYELADRIVLLSHASEKLFAQAGYDANKLSVCYPEMALRQPMYTRSKTCRFLFIATNPYRKGVRVLFEAWDALQLKDATLFCIINTEILQSPLLLRYLVRNPSIHIRPLMSQRKLWRAYADCDCQVLPSFEEGFATAIADGMGFGKPAILSTQTGVAEVVSHLEDGYVIPTGSVQELKNAFGYVTENRHRLAAMGAAAFETARRYPVKRAQREMVELVASFLPHG